MHYLITRFLVPLSRKFMFDTVSVYVLIAAGMKWILTTDIAVCIAISMYWDKTMEVAGSVHSLPLFLLVFLAGFGDATSSVIYWPLISRYQAKYSSALAVGESMIGAIVGGLGLIQQPSN